MTDPNNIVIKDLGKKVAIVTVIHLTSTLLNSIVTYKQYKEPRDLNSSIISILAVTIPGSIGSLGSTLYLKDNGEYNYLYLLLHAIPLTTRTITYFIPKYS